MQLGGRVAEELTCDDISTGAANDLSEATHMARQMVRDWGMSDRLGPMAWGAADPAFVYSELGASREYSDETAHVIDTEVERLLVEQRDRARQILTDHLDALEAVAQALIEHETLSGEAVARIVDGTGGAATASHETTTAAPAPAPPAVTAGRH